MIALLLAALLAADPASRPPATAPDPSAAGTVERRGEGHEKAPARAEDPDPAMLRELELLERYELLENPELFGADGN